MDTYLKRKDLSRYQTSRTSDIVILLSQRIAGCAQSISISAKHFLFWSFFDVEVLLMHAHAAGEA